MKKIIFIGGPPGAGKTEFIKKYHLNKYKVFDLDTYRKENKDLSIHNPFSYSESTAKDAGLKMSKDIERSFLNNYTIVIETTFSSLNNTLEQIHENSNYKIYVYLFVINEIEFFISTLERYIKNYIKNENCRLIEFERYLSKLKFYEEYINKIKNYKVNISYVSRNYDNIKIYNRYPITKKVNNIEYYSNRINKIKKFCKQKNTEKLLNELNKMLNFYENNYKINLEVEMKKEKSCGAIIEYNGKILLIQQQKSGNFGFPKGHVLPDESEIETAIREVKEETNVDIEIDSEKRYSLSYIQNENIDKEVVYFLAKPKGNFEIKKQETEISNIYWVDKEKVRETLTYENLKQIWDQVYNDL